MITGKVCNVCKANLLSPKGVKGYTEYEDYQEVVYSSPFFGHMKNTLMVHFCVNFHSGGDMCKTCAIKAIKTAARKLT